MTALPTPQDVLKNLLSNTLDSLGGAGRVLSLLSAVPVHVELQAQVTFRITVANFPTIVVDEMVSAAVDAQHPESPSIHVKPPHFTLDNGSTPSIAAAAARLVETAQRTLLADKDSAAK